MTTKTLFAGLAGGVALFGMGSLIYILLLPEFFAVASAKSSPQFLYIVLGEIAFGMMMAMVFSRTGVTTMVLGAKHGAFLGGMIALGMGLIFFGAYDFAGMDYWIGEVVAWAVRWGVAGAVIGQMLDVKKEELVAA